MNKIILFRMKSMKLLSTHWESFWNSLVVLFGCHFKAQLKDQKIHTLYRLKTNRSLTVSLVRLLVVFLLSGLVVGGLGAFADDDNNDWNWPEQIYFPQHPSASDPTAAAAAPASKESGRSGGRKKGRKGGGAKTAEKDEPRDPLPSPYPLLRLAMPVLADAQIIVPSGIYLVKPSFTADALPDEPPPDMHDPHLIVALTHGDQTVARLTLNRVGMAASNNPEKKSDASIDKKHSTDPTTSDTATSDAESEDIKPHRHGHNENADKTEENTSLDNGDQVNGDNLSADNMQQPQSGHQRHKHGGAKGQTSPVTSMHSKKENYVSPFKVESTLSPDQKTLTITLMQGKNRFESEPLPIMTDQRHVLTF